MNINEQFNIIKAWLRNEEIEERHPNNRQWCLMTDKEPKFNFNGSYRIKPEPKPEPTLLERIEAAYPGKEVVMLEWDEHCDGIWMLSMSYKDCNFRHVSAQSMKGFFKYVYDGSEGLFLDVEPCLLSARSDGKTAQPVAVLFSK